MVFIRVERTCISISDKQGFQTSDSQCTKPLNRKGSLGLWVLVLFLLLIYLGNVFGPPPPSTVAVAWSAQAMWMIVAWGFWIDRNRSVTAGFARRDSGR